jgi:hypothetical protein
MNKYEGGIIKGENHALDDFCCASYSVATGFQLAYSWRSDSPAADSGLGHPGHQLVQWSPFGILIVF